MLNRIAFFICFSFIFFLTLCVTSTFFPNIYSTVYFRTVYADETSGTWITIKQVIKNPLRYLNRISNFVIRSAMFLLCKGLIVK